MHDNQGRIYTENGQGIDVRGDVAYVLGRTTTGDVGQLCGDVDANGARLTTPKINEWSPYKPYRHASPETTLANRQAAMYGWDILIKESGANTLDFVNRIDAYYGQGKDKCWDYLLPRGLGGGAGGANEWYRILDFDGYWHGAKAYRTPVTYNQVGSVNWWQPNTSIALTFNGNDSTQQTRRVEAEVDYTGNERGYSLSFNASLTNPSPSTIGASCNVYGQVRIMWRTLDSTTWQMMSSSVFQWSSGSSSISGKASGSFPSAWRPGNRYRVAIVFELTNRTMYSGEYVAQTVTVNIPYGYFFKTMSGGTDGVYVKPGTDDGALDRNARELIFGTSTQLAPMVIVKTSGWGGDFYYYSIVRLSEAAGYGGFIMFDELPAQTHPGLCSTYLVYGNPDEVFPMGETAETLPYADSTRLVAAPYCRHIFV